MTDPSDSAEKERLAREHFHDRIISWLLAAIWVFAAWYVWRSKADIPLSMLAIATLFFILLVPAMKELARIVDRWLRTELGFGEHGDDR